MQVQYLQYAGPRAVRAAAILTTSYVPGTILGLPVNGTVPQIDGQLIADNLPEYMNHLALEVDFTIGSLTSAQIQIEVSEDNSNWFILQTGVNTTGSIAIADSFVTFTTTSKKYIDINALFLNGGPIQARYVRVSAKGTGTVTSSSMAITAVFGVAQ